MKVYIINLLVILCVFNYISCKEDIPLKIMNSLADKVNAEELFKVFNMVYDKTLNSELAKKRFQTFKTKLNRWKIQSSTTFPFSKSFDLTFDDDEDDENEILIPIVDPSIKKNLFPNTSKAGVTFTPIDWTATGCIILPPKVKEASSAYIAAMGMATAISALDCLKNNNVLSTYSIQQIWDCEIKEIFFSQIICIWFMLLEYI